MSEVAKTGGLPANITSMAAALSQSSVAAGAAGGGELYMQFTKFGEWVYGAEKEETEEGSQWAINPAGFSHGFIAWDQGNTSNGPTGEVMVSATQPMPLEENLPDVKGKWAKAIGVQLRCVSGEDEGAQSVWKANSLGARKTYAEILQAVVARIGEGVDTVVPLVELKNDSYTHKTYGKIFTPVVEIVGWATMEGEAVAEPAAAIEEQEPSTQAAEPEAEEKPARRRRRKAS
jgi:hypothetical protein